MENVCDTLHRPAHSNGLLLLKLKRKLVYKGHVYFEPVRPQLISELLQYLKNNNQFYSNVAIDLNQVSNELLQFNNDTDISICDNNDIVESCVQSQNEQLDETEEDVNYGSPLGPHLSALLKELSISRWKLRSRDGSSISRSKLPSRDRSFHLRSRDRA